MAGEVQEDIIETWFAKRESADRNAGLVEATNHVGGHLRSGVHRELNGGTVNVWLVLGQVTNDADVLHRLGVAGEGDGHNRGTEVGLKVRRSSFGNDLAVIENDELARQAVGLFEILRRQENRDTGSHEVLNNDPEVLTALRVKTGRGFVEKENWGIRDEGRCEVKSAAHSAGVRLGGTVTRVR